MGPQGTFQVSGREIEKRKADHLELVAGDGVEHSGSTFLENVRLLNDPVPELSSEDIDTHADFFGKRLRLPLMITSMTGGAEGAGEMNRTLAKVAAEAGLAFAVGSQRVILRYPDRLKDFAVRDAIPDGVLLGNIGVAQLGVLSIEALAGLSSRIEADGLCVHLNPAQELVQPEGDRDFKDLLGKLGALNEALEGRLLVKEVGAGFSPAALEKLNKTGVNVIDVAGAGGTSWTKVEGLRDKGGPGESLGRVLGDWGVPTAFSIVAARRILKEQTTVVASGGLRDGLDAARAIALGADIAGFARPILLALKGGGADGVRLFIENTARELESVMLLTGSRDVKALHQAPHVVTGELRQWLESYGWLADNKGCR